MRKDRVIYLISSTTGENLLGDPIKIPTKRLVYAEENSIRQSEFYQAAVTNLKPEISFTIWVLEYNGESSLEFEGKTYNIIRTFKKNKKELEVICSGLVVPSTDPVIPEVGG